MFNLFGRKTARDFMEDAKETYGLPDAKENPPMPEVKPPKPVKAEQKEHYRVGRTTDGMTTLTLIADYGNSMTLTMNQEACEQMIRMLKATFDVKETPTEEEV